MPAEKKAYRISGHETFSFRYTWLPKAVRALASDPRLFSNEENAMVTLGVGKNMVRSIRFWSQAAGVITAAGRGEHQATEIGCALLGERGLDPFLEDIRTLWLLHWNLSTDFKNPLLAWDYLLNRWPQPELTPSRAIATLLDEAEKHAGAVSPVTLGHHFETFVHTYCPTRGRKGEIQEDNLDCPLVELELLVRVGERESGGASGNREPIYAFRREEKPDITQGLFLFCLANFWQRRHQNEETLPLREIAHGYGSPGQIFKIPEENIRERLERLPDEKKTPFVYVDSANIQQVRRRGDVSAIDLLKAVYAEECVYA